MLYENVLLKTFNQKYSELLIRQENLRKEIATMIYAFYTNNKPLINYYLKKYMLDSGVHDLQVWDAKIGRHKTIPDESNPVGMFTEKTVNIMPKIHIDLVGKVLDLCCSIYNAGADRYLLDENSDINQDLTEKLMDLYESMDFQKKIIDIYKQGYLFNTVLVQPVWRNDKVELDIITPNFCSVESYDNDNSRAKAVMISKSVGNDDKIVYWSDTEHYYVDENGNKEAVTDGEESNGMINPYGKLQFAVLRFNESSDFWGEPQQDLIENNIWYDVREMNSYFIEMFQGLGVGLGVNLSKNGTISLSPNTMILVDNVRAEDQTPSINFSSTGAPLSEIRSNLEYFYKLIGNSKGLSSQSMSNEVTDQSGVAKAYDSAEMQIKKDSHKIIMKAFETDLYEKIAMVYNYHVKETFTDKVSFKIDIVEDEPQINVSEEISIAEFKLNSNMVSILDLMIKDNPDLTTEEAILRLQENKKINEKYLLTVKTDNGKAEDKDGSRTGEDPNSGN
jgi:hypothetical protein